VVAALAALWCASRDRGPMRTVALDATPATSPAPVTAG
jgi:hypothetical protein